MAKHKSKSEDIAMAIADHQYQTSKKFTDDTCQIEGKQWDG